MKIIVPEGLSPEEAKIFRRRETQRRNYHKHPDKRKLISSQQREKNIEAKRAYGRAHYHTNKEQYREAFLKFCELNPTYVSEYGKKYTQDNLDLYAFHASKRRACVKQATPKWLTSEHVHQIRQFFKQANELNMQVDHIIPLQGKTVCGLNVPWNLQLLTRKDNRAKSNKLISMDAVELSY